MKTGRPSSWNPVAELAPGVWTNVVNLASKDRIVLPVVVRRRLSWLDASRRDVLGVVEPDGSAELLAWDPHGADAMTAVSRALKSAHASLQGLVALAAMDRYVRMALDDAGRLVLPSPLVTHLEAETAAVVRVVMRDERLWLWAEPKWQAERAHRLAALLEFTGSRPD